MTYSVIGVILNILKNKEKESFDLFLNKLTNITDLQIEPFLHVYEIISHFKIDSRLKESLETYKSFIEYMETKRIKKRDRTMSVEEWEATNKDEDLCIICYLNKANRVLIPCKHSKIIIN